MARRKATVAAEITGKVVEVFIDEGMTVTEGQVVARLDSVLAEKDFELARSRAETADAAIAAITADLEDATRIMSRVQTLSQKNFATEADLTKAQARVGVLSAQLRQAQSQFETAKIDAKRSASMLDKHQIRAPFAGVVVDRSAQPGEMISPMSVGGYTRTGICTIVDMDSIEIEVDVNEAFIGRVVRRRRRQRDAGCLSGLDHSRLGHRHRADREPREGHGEGAHPLRKEGPAHPARHGGEGELPG